MEKLTSLHNAIIAVCPIDGISLKDGNVRIDYRPEATTQQRIAARQVADNWQEKTPKTVAQLASDIASLPDVKEMELLRYIAAVILLEHNEIAKLFDLATEV